MTYVVKVKQSYEGAGKIRQKIKSLQQRLPLMISLYEYNHSYKKVNHDIIIWDYINKFMFCKQTTQSFVNPTPLRPRGLFSQFHYQRKKNKFSL